MSTSSPSPPPLSPPPPPPPLPTTNPTPISSRKPQTIPWTHQETVFLIQTYQDKWYSLKRGQLKANQWEEVATTVAARCGYDHSHPSKTPIQCRHKMEKLRRRYRDEKRRLALCGGFSNWPFFTLMDSLECGPLPISARPLNNNDDDDDDDDGDGEDEDEYDGGVRYRSKSRSINYILQRPMMVNRFAASEVETKRRRMEEGNGGGEEVGKEVGVAEEMRSFAERMILVERKKMEMMRETEKWRMQMENKRMEMILNSHNKIADIIATMCTSSNHSEFQPQ